MPSLSFLRFHLKANTIVSISLSSTLISSLRLSFIRCLDFHFYLISLWLYSVFWNILSNYFLSSDLSNGLVIFQVLIFTYLPHGSFHILWLVSHDLLSADGLHQAWHCWLEEGEERRADVQNGRKTVAGGSLLAKLSLIKMNPKKCKYLKILWFYAGAGQLQLCCWAWQETEFCARWNCRSNFCC